MTLVRIAPVRIALIRMTLIRMTLVRMIRAGDSVLAISGTTSMGDRAIFAIVAMATDAGGTQALTERRSDSGFSGQST